MIVRHAEDVAVTTLPNSDLKGRLLVASDDIMGHIAYDVSVEAGETVKLRSSDSGQFDHIYYCISGTGDVKVSNGGSYKLKPDSVAAFSSGISAELCVETRLRLYVVYCKDVNPSTERAVLRSLDDIVDTQRDVDWKRGQSRRFLLKADGFGISLTNTTGKQPPAKLGYMNHAESVYCIAGQVNYSWNEGAESVTSRVSPGEGTMYNLNNHDKHVVSAKSSVSLCIFYPPLRGDENHNHDGGYSSYDV